MEQEEITQAPGHCPVCEQELVATRLECVACGTEVTGRFTLGRLATLREPHASLIDMFLRVRGNVKHMERELGLSYPTVRARLDEAFNAAGYERAAEGEDDPMQQMSNLGDMIRARVDEALSRVNLDERIRATVERRAEGARFSEAKKERAQATAAARRAILDQLEAGELTADQAASALRELKDRRP